MAQPRRAYQAELDALEIWVQVARQDASAADRLIDRFSAVIAQLACNRTWAAPSNICCPAFVPVGNYLIFHRPEEDGVLVVRIIHGARHIVPELFE